jgi:phosphonate transport system ATP-binding protein
VTLALAIEAHDLRVRYGRGDGAVDVLRGVDVAVEASSSLALVGPSGSGKTTLLRVLAGLLPPSGGDVRLRLPNDDSPLRHLRRVHVGYIPQHLGLVRGRTALDNVLAGGLARAGGAAVLAGVFPRDEVASAREALESVGLGTKASQRVARLSGGERQRVAIARALHQRPSLLLADEFVSNLDAATADSILELVADLRRRGTTVVMALHDLGLAHAHGDRVLVLRRGEVAASFARGESDPEAVRWLLTG